MPEEIFNINAKIVKLNNGYKMPIIGIGTYSLHGKACAEAVGAALKNGCRMIDTASFYGNEKNVAEAIRKSEVPRKEIFIATKLYPNQFFQAEKAIEQALERLGSGYIDLMLLHHPGENDKKAYKVMEQAVKDGKINSLGLSNYYIKELEFFLPQIEIKPVVVQNEIHPYYQETDVVAYIQRQGIAVEGWYPLGGRGYTEALLNNKELAAIGAKYGKMAAQVILRWNLQRNIIVIPGSQNPKHIKENMDIFDFSLTQEDKCYFRGDNFIKKRKKIIFYVLFPVNLFSVITCQFCSMSLLII